MSDLGWSRSFEEAPGSLARVRSFVRLVCALAEVSGPAADSLLLVTNELATNSVQHAHTRFRVDLRVAGGALRVQVTDGSDVVPTCPPPGDELGAVRGRGLQIVHRLAEDWGVLPVGGYGKVVWARMPPF